jgi:hypothetical protein
MGVPQKWMVYNGWFNHQWLIIWGVENAWKITKKKHGFLKWFQYEVMVVHDLDDLGVPP